MVYLNVHYLVFGEKKLFFSLCLNKLNKQTVFDFVTEQLTKQIDL